MENSWIYVSDDDDDASYSSLTDSDKVDSETEAELYSKVHHELDVSCINSENLTEEPPKLLIYSTSNDNIFSADEKNASLAKKSSSEQSFNQITLNFPNAKRKSSEMGIDCEILEENFKNKSNKKSELVRLDSSDSDNDIWFEPSSTRKNDLKINLSQDTDAVFLSSDSDDEHLSFPLGKRDLDLRNLSMPNIKNYKNSKDLWYINSEDLHRSKKRSHRYHEHFDVTCSNCNRKGHSFRSCPSPRIIKCFVCGGNHTGFRCSNRMCSNCHVSGHDRRKCFRRIYNGVCTICDMIGHGNKNCPDLWRRFHLTTAPFQITKGKQLKQNTNIYCCNCGKSGHFGAKCPLSSKNGFSTWPGVVSYFYPTKILKNRLNYLRKFSYFRANEKSTTSLENKDIHLQPKSEFSKGSNEENMENKNKKKKLRDDMKASQTPVVKERLFPRTPKTQSPIKCSNSYVKKETESPQILIRRQLKKLKMLWNIEAQRRKARREGTNEGVPEECLLESEDNLPEEIKLKAQKRFTRWRKNRIKRLNKKHARNKTLL